MATRARLNLRTSLALVALFAIMVHAMRVNGGERLYLVGGLFYQALFLCATITFVTEMVIFVIFVFAGWGTERDSKIFFLILCSIAAAIELAIVLT